MKKGQGLSTLRKIFWKSHRILLDYISGARSLYIAVFNVRETKKCLITGQQSPQKLECCSKR